NNKKRVYKVLGHGRSTVVKTLSNILTRLGHKTVITELDPSLGYLCFPGVLGVKKMEQINDQYDNSLFFYYGNDKIENKEYYDVICKNIDNVKEKILTDDTIQILLDIQSDNFDNENFFYIVVGDETLFHSINKKNKFFIPCFRYKKIDKLRKIREYFYGSNKKSDINNLSYTPIIIKKKGLKPLQIGEHFLAPSSCLPIGKESKINNLIIKTTKLENNQIVAISYGKDEKEVLDSPIKAFMIHLTDDQYLTVQEKMDDGLIVSGQIRLLEDDFEEIAHF
ncbi:mRNA cleavage and polyadenylation factor IA/II complex, subunit CLP1, partial [Pseudoloma neurophilia]